MLFELFDVKVFLCKVHLLMNCSFYIPARMIISLTPVEVETVSCKGRFIIMILLGFYDALGKLEIGPYHLMIVILLQEIIKHFFSNFNPH